MKTNPSSLTSAALLILLTGTATFAAPATRLVTPARPNAAPVIANPVASSRATAPVALASITPKVETGAGARATSTAKPACTTSACQPRKGCPPRASACGLGMAVQISTRNVGPMRSTTPAAAAMTTTAGNTVATKQNSQLSTPTPTPTVAIRWAAAAIAPPTAESLAARQAELAAADRRVLAVQQKRADDSCPQAQYDLALRYLAGRGVAEDEEQGLAWLEQAAQNGHRAAQEKLAVITTERNLPSASAIEQTLLVKTAPLLDTGNP